MIIRASLDAKHRHGIRSRTGGNHISRVDRGVDSEPPPTIVESGTRQFRGAFLFGSNHNQSAGIQRRITAFRKTLAYPAEFRQVGGVQGEVFEERRVSFVVPECNWRAPTAFFNTLSGLHDAHVLGAGTMQIHKSVGSRVDCGCENCKADDREECPGLSLAQRQCQRQNRSGRQKLPPLRRQFVQGVCCRFIPQGPEK